MKPVTTIIARALPLDSSNVDTDQIIPADWMMRCERSGFDGGLFIRYRTDPSFVLNQTEYKGATIMVSGPNFGCGSSREHAPWALRDYGFQAIISPSFADIFRGNCLKIGLVPVELPQPVVTRIMRAIETDPTIEIEINVEQLRVRAPQLEIDCELPLDEFSQHRLLHGLDDIALTLRHEAQIADYERARDAWLPSLTA